MLVQSLPLTFW